MNPLHWNPSVSNEYFVGVQNLHVGTTSGTLTQLQNSLHNGKRISGIAIAQNNADVVYYTTDGYLWRNGEPVDDGVYKATRANGSWTFQDVTGSLRSKHDPTQNLNGLPAPLTDITVDPNDENRIWVTMGRFISGKKVFYSPNGGTTWINVTKSGLPNLPSTAISYQELSNDRLYIGTDNGVYFTDNSMNCWEKYGNGGPQCMVNDMEINRCAGKIGCRYSWKRIVGSSFNH